MPLATDIRIEDLSFSYEEFIYRTPIKFGGVALDRATNLDVECRVRTAGGRMAKGFGSMPLGNVWSFPSRLMGYEATLDAMKALARRIARILAEYKEPGHPIDITWALESAYFKAALEAAQDLKLAEPIPRLCTLVVASAFDAALHDGFGKVHGLNCYHTYGPQFMSHDLGHYLGTEFKGENLERYILKEPKLHMPLYHLIGALDPLEDADVKTRIADGLPETLPEWIEHDGLTHLKIKLNGDDLAWDVERVLRVDRVAAQTQRRRGVPRWYYSLDFNERCASVDYLLELLTRVKDKTPVGFERI